MATATVTTADKARARLGELEDRREDLRERARKGGRVSAEQLGKLARDIEVAALEVQAAEEADTLKAEADKLGRIEAIAASFNGGGEIAQTVATIAEKEQAALQALRELGKAGAAYSAKASAARRELLRLGCVPNPSRPKERPPVSASSVGSTVDIKGVGFDCDPTFGAKAIMAIAAVALEERRSETDNPDRSLVSEMKKRARTRLGGDILTVSGYLQAPVDRAKVRNQ